ncbi:uncharacterized protein LOC128650740 isoform X1 [Bombina bombina]|uniref:uncharacterized protein LOC128650740 isoform X1 n=1 Tax=Bombina bombina TaxID=8345 RepID=UPI00235B07F4|nr:uncharacterized protein LOC128650740 isoform X1 [Bombina bombina]
MAPQPSTPGLAPGRTIPEAHAISGPMLLPSGPSDLLRQPRGPGPTSGVNAMLVTSPEADIGTSGLADSRAVTRTSAPGATPLAGEHREPSLAVGGLSVGGRRGISSASKLRKRTAHLNVNPQGHQRGRSIIRGSTRQIASDRGRGTRRVNPSRAMRPLQFIQMGDNANAVQQAAPDIINPHRADSGLVQAAAQPHDIVSNNSLHVNQGNVQSMHVNQNIEHHLPSHHLPSPIGVNAALNGVNVQAAPQGYNTPLVGIHNANVQSLSQLQHPITLGIQGVQPLDQGIHSPMAATQGAHAHSLNHAQSISQACHNPIVDQQGVNAQTSANGQSVSQGFHTPLHIAHPPLATDNPDTSIGQSARQILSLLQGAIGSQSAAKTRTNTATVMSGADAGVPGSITAGAAATTSTAQQGSSGLALQNQPAGQPVSSMGQGPPAISHGENALFTHNDLSSSDSSSSDSGSETDSSLGLQGAGQKKMFRMIKKILKRGVKPDTKQDSASNPAPQNPSTEVPAEPLPTRAISERRAALYGDASPGKIYSLHRHLRKKVVSRIHRGKYVNIFDLSVEAYRQREKSAEGTGPKKFKRPDTFDEWLQCFRVFSSCYIEKYPSQSLPILKYTDTIHWIQRNHSEGVWREYDAEFRRKMAGNPSLTFDSTDNQLWQRMDPKGGAPAAATSTQQSAQQSFRNTRSRKRGGTCWPFQDKKCDKGSACTFRHVCRYCSGPHPGSDCIKRRDQANKPPSANLGQKGGNAN